MPVSDKPITCHHSWSVRGQNLRVARSFRGDDGPVWLLLPALSTISSRREWQPFSEAFLERQKQAQAPRPQGVAAPRLIGVDWPGFGESERPHLSYDAELLARFFVDFRCDVCPTDCGLIAAGHAAGLALLAAQGHGLAFRECVLVGLIEGIAEATGSGSISLTGRAHAIRGTVPSL